MACDAVTLLECIIPAIIGRPSGWMHRPSLQYRLFLFFKRQADCSMPSAARQP